MAVGWPTAWDVPSVPPIFEDTDAFSLDGCRGLAAEAFFRDERAPCALESLR